MQGNPVQLNKSQPYAVIDIYYFLRDISRNKWTIAKWVIVAGLLTLAWAMRPELPEMRATVRIDPQDMQGLLSAGLLNVDSEIGMIESWSTASAVVDDLQIFAHTPLQKLPDVKESISRQPESNHPKHWIDITHISFPPAMLENKYRLVIRDETHYQVETIATIDAQVLMYGEVGKKHSIEHESGENWHIRIDSIHAPEGSRFTIHPMERETMIRFVLGSLNVVKRSTHPGSSLIDLEMRMADEALGLKLLDKFSSHYIERSYQRLTASQQKALQRLDQDVARKKEALHKKERELEQFLAKSRMINPKQVSSNLLDMELNIESRLSEAYAKRDRLRLIYTPKHPGMIAINQEISQLEKELSTARRQRENIPAAQNRLQQLEREVAMAAGLYESLVDKHAELQVLIGSVVNTVSLINEPRITEKNRLKRIIQIVALGSTMGLIIAFALILVRASLRHSMVESVNQLNKVSTVPVSVHVLQMEQQKGEPWRVKTESLDTLRSHLPYLTHDVPHAIIAVTAPRNYAISAGLCYDIARAASEKGKTLLIDAFVRNSPMRPLVQSSRQAGLTDILAGKLSLQDAINPLEDSPLHYISSGTSMLTNQILADTDALFENLEKLKHYYESIYLHLPDPFLTPNPENLLTRCDYFFHLVRFGMQVDKVVPHLQYAQQLHTVRQLVIPYELQQPTTLSRFALTRRLMQGASKPESSASKRSGLRSDDDADT